MTCVVRSIFAEIPRPAMAKIRVTNILRCKLWAQSKHVKINDELLTSLNEAMFLIKLTSLHPNFI